MAVIQAIAATDSTKRSNCFWESPLAAAHIPCMNILSSHFQDRYATCREKERVSYGGLLMNTLFLGIGGTAGGCAV